MKAADAALAGDGSVDIHHHVIIDGYRRELDRIGVGAQPGVPLPEWSPDLSLRAMDDNGVAVAVVSIASPGFHFGDLAATAALTALCNRELDELRSGHPDRIAVLAAVPLPDVAAALEQTERALAHDDFDGVGLLTQYAGRHLGAPEWDELLALLAQHAALVHVHPTVPDCWDGRQAVRPSLIEYPFETTRAIVDLARHRVFSRFPSIRWVFSHGGGTLAALADRISGGASGAPIAGGDELDTLIAHSWYDSALVGAPAMTALASIVGCDRIVYGSDVPFVGGARVARERAAFVDVTGRGAPPERRS